ncbi:nucleoside triphosphate pyrophosphohydrolase [Paenarthrobacter ureafaciens]|uniref:nucleoside triphosphate pyrophosphohydrolase n=1 Tax=Paenarthrobacter ureafaciens TaxID=37931 RepID=UPI002DB6CF67|nr:nucleoside triphosphate pyrophosphohydrolase [Paenarthrobacter ureafaciens]MEC3851962.1 nucleoside triphosphate pyrophosphohydrolase [Paenarthrobacter ureafaciens]
MTPESLNQWRLLPKLQNGDELLEWKKIAARKEFAEADLPLVPMWRLSGETIISDLANGRVPSGIEEDLQLLASTHLIVRTDVRGGHGTLMRKMIQSNNPREVLSFLQSTARELKSSNIAAEHICFLAHRYIAARGCAWTYAAPESSSVIIDSTWGLLDGLAWLPHDKTVFDTATGQFRRSIEGKAAIFDAVDHSEHPGADVEWEYRETPTEWIWRSSLSSDQMHIAATGAKRLSDHLDRPIVLMWFIGLLDDSQIECLPWFIAPEIPDLSTGVVLDSTARREIIRTRGDLDRFTNGFVGKKTILSLQPESKHVRDKDFIDHVVQVATRFGLGVEIIGSPLSHPFYLLQSAGVPVSCNVPNSRSGVEYAKLVRDGIPQKIADNGEQLISYEAKGTERSRFFRTKVVEEALELQSSESEEETVEELADLMEIILALRRELNISAADVSEAQRKKRNRTGGFTKGTVLVRTGSYSRPDENPSQGMLPGLDSLIESASPRHVRNLGGKLLIQNVPPTPGRNRTFRETLGNAPVKIEYTSQGIEIELDSADTDGTEMLPWGADDE